MLHPSCKIPNGGLDSSFEMKKSGDQFLRKVTKYSRHYVPKLILTLFVLLYHIPLTQKIHHRTQKMVINASNQKTDTTFKNQPFDMYNFALKPQDDWFTLKALKMHLVRAFQLPLEKLQIHTWANFHAGAETPEPKTRCIFKVFKIQESSWT